MGVRRIYREREMDEKNLPRRLRVQKMAFNGVTAAVAVPASEQVRRQPVEEKKLYVIGIGPGAREQMTVRADRILRESQVIIGYTVYVDLDKRILSTGGIPDNADAPGKGTL